MRFFLIVVLIALCGKAIGQNISAQPFKHELGGGLAHGLWYLKGNDQFPRFYFMYKREFKPGLRYRGAVTSQYHHPRNGFGGMVTLGIDYRATFIGNTSVIVGLDALGHYLTMDLGPSKYRDFALGIGPTVAFDFPISPRLSLVSEVSWIPTYRYRKHFVGLTMAGRFRPYSPRQLSLALHWKF